MEPNSHEKKLEKLSRAITEAILRSGDVRNALLELQKEDLIAAKSFIMLMLRMDGLAELADAIQSSEGGTAGSKPAAKKRRSQFIDGKRLSRSELQFYEYLAKNFDETEWLKENGLIFE